MEHVVGNISGVAADYEVWLKLRDRRALRFLALMATIVMLPLFAIPGIGLSDRPGTRALVFFMVLGGMTVVVFVFTRQINFYFNNPHRFELQLGELDTPELIHAQSMLVGRAKSRATKDLWLRSAAFGDVQARTYLSGGDWEALATGSAISCYDMRAAKLPSVLDSYPSWGRWAWRPFTASGLFFSATFVLFGANIIGSLVTGRSADTDLLATVMTYSLCIAAGFGVVLAIGNQVRESRLARLPTERLIQEWLGGNIDAVTYLKRRSKSHPTATTLAERCGWM